MFQEEGDGKDKQRLTHLRDGEQDDGVFYTERICIFGYGSKRTQEKVAVCVCYLKGGSQQHGEQEEDSHLLALEQHQCVQSESGEHRFSFAAHGGTGWQSESIKSQHGCRYGCHIELCRTCLEPGEVHSPHGTDKAYRSPYTDGGEVFHQIHFISFQRIVGHGVGQG